MCDIYIEVIHVCHRSSHEGTTLLLCDILLNNNEHLIMNIIVLPACCHKHPQLKIVHATNCCQY